MNYVIVTAGGVGSRMGLDVPKQFYCVNNKPLILYTLEAFQNMSQIDYICIVSLDGYDNYFKQLIKDHNLSKVIKITAGGATNQLSIFNGLIALKEFANDDDIIIVHDGIRPLVDSGVVNDCIRVCKKHGNAIAVVPSNEAMLLSENGAISTVSIDRSTIWKTQTPHAMSYKEMFNLVDSTIKSGKTNSVAICTMLIEADKKVWFSKGNNLNFKLTTIEDIDLFKGVLLSENKK